MAEIIDTAIKFWEELLKHDEVIIKFQKKDGHDRVMRATLNFDLIPDREKPKSVNLPKILNLVRKTKIVHVYDLEKRGWRSVPIDKTYWIQTDVNEPLSRITVHVRGR